MKKVYFKVLISDLTEEILNKSLVTNPYKTNRSTDGKYLMLSFKEDNIPLQLLRLGYAQLDQQQAKVELLGEDFDSELDSALVNNSNPKDSDGSPLIRSKITNSGWSYQLHGIEFESSKLDSIYSKKFDGTDWGFTTIKCYDNEDNELTTQIACDTQAVKTVIDWEPTFDYEIFGGFFKLQQPLLSDVRLWVVAVPDIPEIYGGTKEFISNLNLKYIGLEEGIRADGKSPKLLKYDSELHTNKIRIILTHSIGFKNKFSMIFEIFKK